MSEMAENMDFFSVVPIETTYLLVGSDGMAMNGISKIDVTKANLSSLVNNATQAYPQDIQDKPFCIISMQSSQVENFKSAEHFVPEGLGFGWTALPVGTGTCDRINSEFSKYELEWMRFGSMGKYRPFFVAEGKDGAPEFYAPKKTESLFGFRRNAEGKMILQLTSDADLPRPLPGRAGKLEIKVKAKDSSSSSVSLSLHKMAFLALWLSQPGIVFDPLFQPLREFLNCPCEDNYRPMTEEMVAEVTPGVSFRFFMVMTELQDNRSEGQRGFAIDKIFAAVRVHHMLYFIALVGNLADMPTNGIVPKMFEPIGSGREILSGIGFRFDNVAHVALDQSLSDELTSTQDKFEAVEG